ncbi:MAG: HypC/HybG/HupF family hydrogenase formation chaperone [Aeromicrobium sp.]
MGILDAPPAAGDWVLIHMGFAMEIVDESAAVDAIAGLEMIGRPRPPQEMREVRDA